MKPTTIKRAVAIIAVALFSPLLIAGSDHKPVPTMADILIDLNHFPGAEEKAQLEEIAANPENSDGVRTIATALHGMEHQVSPEDKAKLEAIVAADEADEDVKALAGILMNINHKADDEARKKLKELKSGK